MRFYEIDAIVHILVHGQYGEDENDALLSALDDGNYEVIGENIQSYDCTEDDE